MALGLALAAGVTAVHEADALGQAAQRQPAWLGVELDTSRPEARGVRVRHAVRSSPGWTAGIRDGDVIVRIGDVTTLRPDDVSRRMDKIAQHLPADRGIGIEQPIEWGHGGSVKYKFSDSSLLVVVRSG